MTDEGLKDARAKELNVCTRLDKIMTPAILGGRGCYRLSSLMDALMRTRRLDSPAIAWFSFILISIAIQVVYCNSNTRGSSSRFGLPNFGWQEGVIKFHRDKPERDTMR